MALIQDEIYEYICLATHKISELSSLANDKLEKNGCSCDISEYVDAIADINSSLYILNKGWDNIEETFGYNNFLLVLYDPEDGIDAEAAVLSIIHRYIDRYSMSNTASIVFPISDILKAGSSCCAGVTGDLYYNKTESDLRYYPRYDNPEGYLKQVDLDGYATEDYVNNQGFITEELDPTVPEWVKDITEDDKDYWNNKVTDETDPTVPDWVKEITEDDIDEWGNKISVETDPTVPDWVKDISNSNINNWNEAYGVLIDLEAQYIPALIFSTLSFNRLGGYVVGSNSNPISGTNINLSIGANITFSRSTIFHSGLTKPTYTGTGINVTEIGTYENNSVNEILLFYNGSGRVVVIYTGTSEGTSKKLVTRGTVTPVSDTSINIEGFEWEIDGTTFSHPLISGLTVLDRPDNGTRIDLIIGDSSGNVSYIAGSDDDNQPVVPYPDAVILSLFVRKPDGYIHPAYTPLLVNAGVGFVVSKVESDSIGSVIDLETRELSSLDVGLENVDNTSDADKPISDDVQDALDDLDDRFLRKDVDDTNGINKLTLGSLNISSLTDEVTPDFSLTVMSDGSVVRSGYVSPQDIVDINIRIDEIDGDLVDWMHVVRPVQIDYDDEADMIADQNRHVKGYLYWSEEDSSYYQYLGTTTETIADYRLFSSIGGSPPHNSLLGLNGDAPYYHLGLNEYDATINANSPSETNPFLTLGDQVGAGLGLSLDSNDDIQLGADSADGSQTVNLASAGRSGFRIFTASPQMFELNNDKLLLNQQHGVITIDDERSIITHISSNSSLLLSDSLNQFQNNNGDIKWSDSYFQMNSSSVIELNSAENLITTNGGRIKIDNAVDPDDAVALNQLTDAISGIPSPYTHPTYTPVDETLSGSTVIATIETDSIGSVVDLTTRELTLSDLDYEPVTAEDLGLEEFVGLSPETLPISDDTQEALDLKANTTDLADVAFSGSWEDVLDKPIQLKDIIIVWEFDGDKTYNIDPIYYLNEVNHIHLGRVFLLPDGIDYNEDPEAGTIILGALVNPEIGDKIIMNLKMIEI